MSVVGPLVAEGTERLPHLLVVGWVDTERFHRTGGSGNLRQLVNRSTHGLRLLDEIAAAFVVDEEMRGRLSDGELKATGSIIVVEGSEAVYPLKLESLDRARGNWILLAVHVNDSGVERAVVWVADEERSRFLKLFEDYLNLDTLKGKPRNEALVANVGRIRGSLLRDLWLSEGEPPLQGTHWWEIWLRREEGAVATLHRFAEVQRMTVAPQRMELDQRIIVWVRGTWEDLTLITASRVPISEIRRAQFTDSLDDLDDDDQDELVTDLADRLEPAPVEAPAVCLLDTGSRRTHALLVGSLAAKDWHTITRDGPGDSGASGHGTLMAGLALLGPVDGPLLASGRVTLLHRLESVKILPDSGPGHDQKAYGFVTAQAVSMPVTTAERRRVFCMPISAPRERSTQPSLWSASIDALAAGTDIGGGGGGGSDDGITLLGPPDQSAARLFILAAGNVEPPEPHVDYLDNCDASVVEDPAQAWNALVVGASTLLTATPADPSFAGWGTLAPEGGLSPHSRTGVTLSPQWPIRPDICMEGGNLLTDGLGFHDDHAVVSLMSSSRKSDMSIGKVNATSAATAQASRLAARAMAVYPDYWPESIRGLLTHGAEWTPLMASEFDAANSVVAKRAVLGRYGWGIPQEDAVLSSGARAVTMVIQDAFVPFTGPDFAMREFRLHRLPWPSEVLSGLLHEEVRLKVTLSYFIEPSAPRRGWRSRYGYASHGLRFELQNKTETTDAFMNRVNHEAGREEGGASSGSNSGVDRWTVGPLVRNRGSLHQDMWTGSGADLAQCGVLAVHPVGGWWKNGRRKDRQELPVRYSLILSLSTNAEDVDIYQPIATQLGIAISNVAIAV